MPFSWDWLNKKSLFRGQQKGESLEIYATQRVEQMAAMAQDKLKEIVHKEYLGVGVRLMKKQRIGFASTSDLKTLAETIAEARALSPFATPVRFSFPSGLRSTYEIDDKPKAISAKKLTAICEQAKDQVKSAVRRAKVDVRVGSSFTEVGLANSNGVRGAYRKALFTKMVAATLTNKGLLQIVEASVTPHQPKWSRKLEQRLIQKIQWAKRVCAIKQKLDWIVFTPEAVGHLTSPLKMALSGKLVAKKVSPLAAQIGKKVFDPQLTITDDPTLSEGILSHPFDGEGVRSKPLSLIRQGRVAHLLLDLKSAGELKKKSNGRGSRSAFSQPAPAGTNWVIEKGQVPLADLFKEKLVLVIHQGIGWAGNPLSGAVAFNVELGFLWSRGECLGRCKDVMVSGNIYDILKSDIVLTRDREWAFGETLSPYLAVQRMTTTQGG